MRFRPATRRAVAAGALTLILAACGSESDTIVAEPGADDSAPALVATADGGQIDLNALEGTDTVLWFWAPW